MATILIFILYESCKIIDINTSSLEMWQDKEVRFDIPYNQMQLRLGEFAVDKLDLIEDTKGNAGDNGRLIVTNLRTIWHSLLLPRINLSIGYNAFVAVNSKTIHTVERKSSQTFVYARDRLSLGKVEYVIKLQGRHMQALYILTSYRNCRYEFIFTNQNPKSTRHYTSVIGIYRAYISSKIYREIKLRSGIINDQQLLTLLPQEIVSSTSQDIWNLSLEQGNMGTLIVTNIRLVWFANMNYQFNISIPYLVIGNITIKNSKFGSTLVISSTESSGGYILGFRVRPMQRLQTLYKEILMLYKTFDKFPIFGVDYTFEHEAPLQQELNIEQYSEIQDSQVEILNVFGYYFSEGFNQRKPSFSNYLGLAAENSEETIKLQSIWELVPQN